MKNRIMRLFTLLCVLVMTVCMAGCSLVAETSATKNTTMVTTTEASKDESKETSATTEETTTATETTTEATTESTTEATTETTTEATTESTTETTNGALKENEAYTSKDDVALFIHTYGHLPNNFVTKKDARARGWEGGSLDEFFPGCSIGGDVFGNREGLLPSKRGRTYYECDIDTKGKKSRGAKRIVFSDDGLIYYTGDHYETFTLLYGEA